MKNTLVLLFVLFLATTAFISGCKDDDDNPTNPGGGGSTTYVGSFADSSGGGSMTFNIPNSKISIPTDTINITGKIYLASGDSVSLTGIYDDATSFINVTGGGYTFTGTLSSGQIIGTFNGPNGNGTFAASSSGSTTVKVYCGEYIEDAPGTSQGTFNLLLNGNAITVITSDATFYGTVSGSTVTIYLVGTSGATLATGTVTSSTTMSGQYTAPGGEHGTWMAEICR